MSTWHHASGPPPLSPVETSSAGRLPRVPLDNDITTHSTSSPPALPQLRRTSVPTITDTPYSPPLPTATTSNDTVYHCRRAIILYQVLCYLALVQLYLQFYFARGGVRSIVMGTNVFLCLFVYRLAYLENTPNFLYMMLTVVLAQFCSGGVALCYVLPVLWMT